MRSARPRRRSCRSPKWFWTRPDKLQVYLARYAHLSGKCRRCARGTPSAGAMHFDCVNKTAQSGEKRGRALGSPAFVYLCALCARSLVPGPCLCTDRRRSVFFSIQDRYRLAAGNIRGLEWRFKGKNNLFSYIWPGEVPMAHCGRACMVHGRIAGIFYNKRGRK